MLEFQAIRESFLCGTAHPKGQAGGKVPHAVDVDQYGNVLIGDTAVNRIRIADVSTGQVYTIVGSGEEGFPGEACPALGAKIGVHGLRIDKLGNIYFVDFLHHMVMVARFERKKA